MRVPLMTPWSMTVKLPYAALRTVKSTRPSSAARMIEPPAKSVPVCSFV